MRLRPITLHRTATRRRSMTLLRTATLRARFETHRRLTVLTAALIIRTAASVALPGLASAAVAEALRARTVGGTATLLLAGCLVVMAAGDITVAYAGTAATVRRTAEQRVMLTRHLLGLRRRPDTGDAVTRIVHASSDAARIAPAVLSSAVSITAALIAVGLIWWTDWASGLAFTLTVGLVPLAARGPIAALQRTQTRYLQAQTRIADRLLAVLDGARTVRASGTTELEIRRILQGTPALSAAGREGWSVQRGLVVRVRSAAALVQVATLVVAGLSVAAGRIEPAALLAVVGYTALAMTGIEQIDALGELTASNASARRVRELLSRPVRERGTYPLAHGGALDVRWRGVHVDGALSDIDLHLPAGSSLALVGPSGAGKSVLAATVCGLVPPDAGRVLLAGQPLDTLDPQAVADAVAYAFDTPGLLGDTVADVIAYPGTPLATDVRAAADLARANVFVRRLPDGYATALTHCPLSGGERQRLGLARAFARHPRVLVLDDAASGLDAATAGEIHRVLFDTLHGRTRLIAAHHLRTAAACDRVAWLQEGRVHATGTHRQLWQDPAYRALFAQHGDPADEPAPDTAGVAA